jgi:hypothetical protein
MVVLDTGYIAWRNARRHETEPEEVRPEEQPSIVLPFTFTDSPMEMHAEVQIILRQPGPMKS